MNILRLIIIIPILFFLSSQIDGNMLIKFGIYLTGVAHGAWVACDVFKDRYHN